MNLTTRALLRALLAGTGLMLAAPAIAQESDGERERLGIEDLLPAAEKSPQEEMIELFQKVERRLTVMGGYLLDAGAGDTSRLRSVEAAGIEDLLAEARPQQPRMTGGLADLLAASEAEGKRALEDIDRILQLAAENGGT